MPLCDPLLGRTVAGRYNVLSVLGTGGMGAVYRARQLPVGREVALKVIRARGDRPAVVEARFTQEAQVISRLRHPGNVTLFDFGVEDDGTLFKALELVEGETLAERIRRSRMPWDRACRVMACVLDALVEAHALGLVHRGLKPANIMIAPSSWGREQVKVLDFGIAKAVAAGEAEDEGSDRLTRTGAVFGTPHSMSPEQSYDHPLDGRSDVYAAGVPGRGRRRGDRPRGGRPPCLGRQADGRGRRRAGPRRRRPAGARTASAVPDRCTSRPRIARRGPRRNIHRAPCGGCRPRCAPAPAGAAPGPAA